MDIRGNTGSIPETQKDTSVGILTRRAAPTIEDKVAPLTKIVGV
jgi:hypothetical protein